MPHNMKLISIYTKYESLYTTVLVALNIYIGLHYFVALFNQMFKKCIVWNSNTKFGWKCQGRFLIPVGHWYEEKCCVWGGELLCMRRCVEERRRSAVYEEKCGGEEEKCCVWGAVWRRGGEVLCMRRSVEERRSVVYEEKCYVVEVLCMRRSVEERRSVVY